GASHLYLLDPFDNNSAEIKGSLEKAYPDVKVTIVKGDASDDSVVSSLCQKVLDEAGRLDIYYANGAICTWKPLADTSFEDFMNTIKINSGSAFLALKHGSRAMAVTSAGKPDSGGSIIFTSSLAGMRGNTGSVDCTSPSPINSIAMVGAAQLTGQNIRVNSICPGIIDTNMVAGVFDAYEADGKRNRLGWAAPLQRHALPAEIATTALFLASDDSSFVNGQNIVVDGGNTFLFLLSWNGRRLTLLRAFIGLGGGVPAVDEPLSKMK
ncbi:hypothetical protein M407DRAFT_75854, partial [Tulasnella calospora MUT 4182]